MSRRTTRPRSIRTRLTVGTAIVAAAVLGLLAVAVAVQARDAASRAATQLAVDDLQSYAADLRRQPNEAPDAVAAGELVLLRGPDGTTRRTSMPISLAHAAVAVDDTESLTVAGDEFRVVARTVRTPSGVWRLWAARDVTASDSVVEGVLTAVLIGTPVAVGMTAVTAWLVATAALRPVERLRLSADRLRAPGAVGLLPDRGAAELADLGVTLNGLITDLRASVSHERRVTADAAHELRTPLAVLKAQVELAERHPVGADLPAIRASVDRMSRLADGLIVLSRADSQLGDPPPDASVGSLVTEAMAAVDRGRLLASPGVLVDLELVGVLDETAKVAIDATGFERILANLIGNAVAAGPATAATVRLSHDGGALVLEVEDDGSGVPDGFLPFAFDRFARPEGAPRGDSSGAGLGLALVKRLTELGGGTASLQNRAGGGAIAIVRIPRIPAR